MSLPCLHKLKNDVAMICERTSGLIKGTSWMMVSEVMARASRIVTLIVFAAYFTPVEYGTVMLALVCHELIRVFSRLGIGAKIIQCDASDLKGYASNAITLQWLVCIALLIFQVAVSGVIARFYDNEELTLLLIIMSFSHLLYPIVTVKVFLVQRVRNMRFFGIASGISIVVDNLSGALLLLLDFGLLSVAYAKLLAAGVWVAIFITAKVETFKPAFCSFYMPLLLSFSSKVLGSEMLKVLRLQLDVLFAGRLLSPELFGLYSFAKSSGVGLSQSLSSGFIASLYPYLSESRRKGKLSSVIRYAFGGGAVLSIAFVIQAVIAPIYINLLFGGQWEDAIPLVTVLCFSAIGMLMLDISNTVLRVQGMVVWELYQSLYCVLLMAVILICVRPVLSMDLALLTTLISFLWLPIIGFVILVNQSHSNGRKEVVL